MNMMYRFLILAAGTLGLIAILIYGTNLQDTGVMTIGDREAALNTQNVNIETETEGDETRLPVSVTETPEVAFDVDPGGVTAPPDEEGSVLTVEGYDPQRVRYLLQESDLRVEVREDYLSRLETASDDRGELAAVLATLRAELDMDG